MRRENGFKVWLNWHLFRSETEIWEDVVWEKGKQPTSATIAYCKSKKIHTLALAFNYKEQPLVTHQNIAFINILYISCLRWKPLVGRSRL